MLGGHLWRWNSPAVWWAKYSLQPLGLRLLAHTVSCHGITVELGVGLALGNRSHPGG